MSGTHPFRRVLWLGSGADQWEAPPGLISNSKADASTRETFRLSRSLPRSDKLQWRSISVVQSSTARSSVNADRVSRGQRGAGSAAVDLAKQREYIYKAMRTFDTNAFFERMNFESERACAILGGALLDARLEHLFRRKLRCSHDELLEGTGPIGTFSARIRLARALDWISEDARFDLDIIRKIRNDFAHSFDHSLSFNDQSITDRCASLRTAQAFIDGYEVAAVAPNQNLSAEAIHAIQSTFKPPRWRYQLAVEFLSQYLDQITSEIAAYCGTDLIGEVRALSANTRAHSSGTGTVVPPPESQ
jgi:DNA-binding MltR family transcriptional regulator